MNSSKWEANVPAKRPRKMRPLVKPLEIPQPPPTAFDLFCEEEKQTWSKEYRQSMSDSYPVKAFLGNRPKDHLHLALAFRWNSLTKDERARFEHRAQEHYICFQQEVVRYKYMAGQLNSCYRYAVAKKGTRLHSINWSQQMIMTHSHTFPHHTKGSNSISHKANILSQPSVGIKHAPMGPPPPILSPKLVTSALSSPLTITSLKLPSNHQSSFHFAWSVVDSLDQGISSLLKETSGSCATIKSNTVSHV